MEQLLRFKIPAIIGAGAIVVVAALFLGLIKPQGAKLSSLHQHETALETQQAQLEAKIATLKHDKAQMAANCAKLQKAMTEIPGTPDVAAFLQQVTALAVASGDPNTPTISVLQAPRAAAGGATPVQVSLTLNGTYGQMSAFIKGLDSFPRLFTVTNISVGGGVVAAGGGAVNPGAGGYNLSLTGAVYYATGRQNACAAPGSTAASGTGARAGATG
jgi:Tfp pilus assembly protein PilO